MDTPKRWTQADITDLRARFSAGDTVDDIAAALARTDADITTMMQRLRLRRMATV
ncbi:hypothetical protein [Sphingomonas oligophenolica]|uniref:hypothetical protein n=1 Tax=Sphingomonas oligophenolica TaxID=301154 RepID=UPI001386D46D|nr:hypothetical protein [Sphingomonas oligophenolica]